ncbi:MAG: TIR domain-containing protein [Anaerolineales bacterium]|nr:TIR domain-containing protein [Anaerolineales bacterium]
MKTVFISYSSKDREFVHKLALDLREMGVGIWFDQWEIKTGDSIIDKISSGLSENDFLAVVLTPNSVASEWVKRELNSALSKEIYERKVNVLPILYKDCIIPVLLRDKQYANFTKSYDNGLKELLAAIAPENFDDTTDLNKQLSRYYIRQAIGFEEINNPSEAIKYYQRAINICPSNAEAYYDFGVFKIYSGRLEDARDLFLKTLELNPKHASALINLGGVYLELLDAQAAINVFEKAIKLDIKDYACSRQLGQAYLSVHMYQNAIEPLLDAASLAPTISEFATVMFFLSAAYMGLNELGYQLAYLEECVLTKEKIQQEVPFDIYANLVDGLAKIGESNNAIEFYKRAASVYGNDPRLQELENAIRINQEYLKFFSAENKITNNRLAYTTCKANLLKGRTISFGQIKTVAGKSVIVTPKIQS